MVSRFTTGQRIFAGACALWFAACSLLATSPFHAEEHAADDAHEGGCIFCLFAGDQIEPPTSMPPSEHGAALLHPFAVTPESFLASIDFLAPPGRAPPASFLL